MALEAQDNPFPYVTLVETADPSTPAAGTKRVWLDTDGVIKEIDDADVVAPLGGTFSGDAGDIPFTPVGTIAATDVQAAIAEVASEAAADLAAAVSALPVLSNQAGNYSASTTSLVITMAAPTAGDNLVCLIGSTGRGANSITQTNVVWTQRYTGNGNNQYFEIWTGVVSASAGTTATIALTGSNKVFAETFVVDGIAPFTAAAALSSGTATAGSGTVSAHQATAGAAGDLVICAVSANSPASAYQGVNVPAGVTGTSALGGAFRFMLVRAPTGKVLHYWTVQSSSVGWFLAFVKVS